MKIAILDDEAEMREDLARYLGQTLLRDWPIEASEAEVACFSSPKELLEREQQDEYDLVFLDILMPEMNGMDVARQLRARQPDMGIIFLTSSEAYLLDGYRVFADGYFLKPVGTDEEGFNAALRRVFSRIGRKKRALPIRVSGRNFSLPFHQILYIDIQEARLHIVLQEREFHLSRPYSYHWAAERLLEDKRFQECYHRIIVNMDMVANMGNMSFILKNKISLPISQRRRNAVKAAYMRYLLEQ